MGMGGSFYAVSDDQMIRALSGTLPWDAFRSNALDERPAECFSDGEHVWFELSKLLDPEHACGRHQSDRLPEAVGCNHALNARLTALALGRLDLVELETRYAALDTEWSFDEVHAAGDARAAKEADYFEALRAGKTTVELLGLDTASIRRDSL